MTLHCLVADDHPAIVTFLREFLAGEGYEVDATANDGEEALEKITNRHPDVALLDIRMPRLGGIDIARSAAKTSPQTAIIAYTGFGDEAMVSDALDAGIRGIVQKDAPLADVRRAIEIVAAGGVYIDPTLSGKIAGSKGRVREARPLTQREREVLRLLAEGLHNDEIGRRLFISPETVRTHIGKAMDKLGAETRTQAVAMAIREQLIQ